MTKDVRGVSIIQCLVECDIDSKVSVFSETIAAIAAIAVNRVRICLVTPYIYGILRVVALAALVTQNHGGLRVHRNTVVPSNGVNNLYCCVVIT